MKFRFIIVLLIFTLMSCATPAKQKADPREIALKTQQLGEEQYRNGKYTLALKNLLEAEEHLANDPFLNNSLGLVYLAKRRLTLAEKHFKKAIKLNPEYAQAKNNLGGVYMKLKKWDLAIEMFEAVLANLLYPTPAIPLSNIGWAYFYQNRFHPAKKYFNQSLDIRPHFINAVHGLASIYLAEHNYTKALSFIHASLKLNPGAPILHADLATTYEALGELKKARDSWNVVLSLVPERSPLAKEAEKHLGR